MEMSAHFDYSKVLFDKDNDVVLSIDLKAPSMQDDKRQPLNLVAVLDVSGSMAGDKMERMKRTIQTLIDHLSEHDKLGVVIFSSSFTKLAGVETMTQDRKDELKNRISTLQPMESTNISGAMLLGFELLSVKDGNINRVLLLTDGLPNVGESTIPGLVGLVNNRPKGMSLSTFGFGTDHNPELLQSMAQAGDGNYYFIENADKINTSFAQELGGLISSYAQNIKIEAKFKPGVKDVTVINTAWEWEYDEENLVVRIPDLFAEETKNILVKVSLEKRTSALPREVTIADIKTSFTNLINKKDETVEEKAKIEFVKNGDESKERDKEIVKQEARLNAAEAQRKAVEMATCGDFVGAQNVMRSATCCLFSAGDSQYAHEVEEMTSGFTADTYSPMNGFNALSNAYSTSRGRAGGQSRGLNVNECSNSFQKNMMQSFDSNKIIIPTEGYKAPDESKKSKKKKHNPMTK
jgi:Ca-activated chloride channel family protein